MKLELVIPTSLSEIPLKSYQKFISIAENSNDDEFVAQKMIETFCGIELKDIVKMKYSDVVDLVQHFENMFTTKTPFVQRFKIKDVEFGFIPELENISLGEFVDLESNLFDKKALNKAMAVMYRPITTKYKDKYNIEPYETSAKYDEVMNFAPLNVVLGAKVFFWNLRRELVNLIPTYLENQAKEMSTQQKHNLLNDGDGISQSMHSLKEILETLMQSQSYHLESALPTLHLKSIKQK